MSELKKHIILTDDDPGVQDAAKLMFERAGYDVTVYSNGNPLLKNDFKTPDLFILDKQLSGVDGLDICRFLKAQHATAHIPVIMLSASPQLGVQSRAAGADAFVEKPFRMSDILTAIRQFI